MLPRPDCRPALQVRSRWIWLTCRPYAEGKGGLRCWQPEIRTLDDAIDFYNGGFTLTALINFSVDPQTPGFLLGCRTTLMRLHSATASIWAGEDLGQHPNSAPFGLFLTASQHLGAGIRSVLQIALVAG